MKYVIIAVTLVLGWLAGPGNTREPEVLVYEGQIQVTGTERFLQETEAALLILEEHPPLTWWVVWASEKGVNIRQSAQYAMFWQPGLMTAHGSTMTIVVHPPGQEMDTLSYAILLMHELRHLMDYPVWDEREAWEDVVLAAWVLEWEYRAWAEEMYADAR